MKSTATTPEQYIESLPEDRKTAMQRLRDVINANLPDGFREEMSYGMPGYVIPHELYPSGYHCDPKLPLPFINIASQKNFIAIYHMGLYADQELMDWYLSEYSRFSSKKPDMGKSCLRFKNSSDIPFEIIGKLAARITPAQWISAYERAFRSK